MARSLQLYEAYTREEVHGIFDGDSRFTRSAGTWGLQGIIEISRRPGDFVFFVTFGRSQGEHTFDEGISSEGILRWQSQPKQILADAQIRELINHNEFENSIYLFLRTKITEGAARLPYSYLGTLKYRGHDRQRERPVYFEWQLLDWPMPASVSTQINLQFDKPKYFSREVTQVQVDARDQLTEEVPPNQRKDNPETTLEFRAKKRRYPSDTESRALGKMGELLVLKCEKTTLKKAGRMDLMAKVRHISEEEGDGAGYDVLSYFADGRPKYIEVKTTTGPKTTDYFLTANEVAFAKARPDAYELRRLFDFD